MKYTGAIILATIGFIFSLDAVLSLYHGMTISEWFYDFLHLDPLVGLTIYITFFVGLLAHFWWFRANDK